MEYTPEQVEALAKWWGTVEHLPTLTDEVIFKSAIEHIWANMRLGSPEELLLSELLDRFEKYAGLKDK